MRYPVGNPVDVSADIEAANNTEALTGLYLIIWDHEKVFRCNPVGASSTIVRKVFGTLQ